MPKKFVNISISVPIEFKELIHNKSHEAKMGKSEFIRQAIQAKIDSMEKVKDGK